MGEGVACLSCSLSDLEDLLQELTTSTQTLRADGNRRVLEELLGVARGSSRGSSSVSSSSFAVYESDAAAVGTPNLHFPAPHLSTHCPPLACTSATLSGSLCDCSKFWGATLPVLYSLGTCVYMYIYHIP